MKAVQHEDERLPPRWGGGAAAKVRLAKIFARLLFPTGGSRFFLWSN